MTPQTVVLSSYDAYLSWEDDPEELATQEHDRGMRLLRFPHSVMLQIAFPEIDFANRWCWQRFGPAHGECMQDASEYKACDLATPHCHVGRWTYHWFDKTDYNFGFNEWYFENASECDSFLANLESINWGEHYPK